MSGEVTQQQIPQPLIHDDLKKVLFKNIILKSFKK